jgi:hypothetical protein
MWDKISHFFHKLQIITIFLWTCGTYGPHMCQYVPLFQLNCNLDILLRSEIEWATQLYLSDRAMIQFDQRLQDQIPPIQYIPARFPWFYIVSYIKIWVDNSCPFKNRCWNQESDVVWWWGRCSSDLCMTNRTTIGSQSSLVWLISLCLVVANVDVF